MYDTPEIVSYIMHSNEVSKVVIGDGVTTIGKSAFFGLDLLEEVHLPSSITMIDEYAFAGCESLEVGTFDGNDFNDITVKSGNEVLIQLFCKHVEVEDPGVDFTCTSSGLTKGSHCSRCGEILVEQYVIPADGHTVIYYKAVPATYTKTGLTEGRYCSVCHVY